MGNMQTALGIVRIFAQIWLSDFCSQQFIPCIAIDIDAAYMQNGAL